MQEQAARRLRVYTGERQRWHGHSVVQEIVQRARAHGMAGATVVHGVEGYGGHSKVHSLHPFSLSADLPVVVEVVDVPERIDDFLPQVLEVVDRGMVTVDQVRAVFLRRSPSARRHG